MVYPVNKKADVVERPQAFQHVGLLVNKRSGTASLLFNQSSGEREHIAKPPFSGGTTRPAVTMIPLFPEERNNADLKPA